MTSGKATTLVPVESDDNIIAMRQLRGLLQSTAGPNGSSKLFVTEGGVSQLTATSSTLLERLELENPICRYIAQVSRGLPDYGFYFTVLVSHLLEQQWMNDLIPKHKLMQTISSLTQTVQDLLASELVCRKVDFSSINSFLPLVRTVLSSKSSTLSAGLDLNQLGFEVVKLFLNCVDEQTNTVGRIYIKVESGLNHISSHNGLLYQVVEDHDLEIIKEISGVIIKLLLFTCKLETSGVERSLIKTEIMQILEQAVQHNVKMIACQKTVSAEVRLYLTRRNIILLDRMGTDLTTELVQMSQAFPISSIDVGILDMSRLVGELTSVQHVQFSEADYVLLQNDKASVGTLLVLNRSLADVEHVKILAQQAVGALRSLASHPFLTFGGGCLEAWLISQLVLLNENQADKDLRTVSRWLQKALLSACGPCPPDAVDSVYHHGWDDVDRAQCKCGLVSSSQLAQSHSQLIYLCEVTNSCLKPASQLITALHAQVLVDSHQQKTNVIMSALEIFANLSDIGLILYEN